MATGISASDATNKCWGYNPRRGIDTRVAYLRVYVLIPIQFLADVHIEFK